MICKEGLNTANSQILNLALHNSDSDLIINSKTDMKWLLLSGVNP